MTDTKPAGAFAAFRDAVHADPALARAARTAHGPDAFIAHVIAIGAAHGFHFDESAVRAAMRAGEERWLSLGADVV